MIYSTCDYFQQNRWRLNETAFLNGNKSIMLIIGDVIMYRENLVFDKKNIEIMLAESKSDGNMYLVANETEQSFSSTICTLNRHFIFWVTSYQREKWSLHTRHFILVHYIPCGTSYQSHFIPVHLIPRPLHTSHFILCVTSYRGHFIPKSNQRLHTNALHTSHFMPVTLYQSLNPSAFHISEKYAIICWKYTILNLKIKRSIV